MEYQHIPAGTYIDPGIGKQTVYETHDLQKNPIVFPLSLKFRLNQDDYSSTTFTDFIICAS